MASSTQVRVGTKVRLFAAFTTIGGAPTAPTAVTCQVSRPDGTVDTVATTATTTGCYYGDYSTTGRDAGTYTFRFSGTGTCEAAGESTFTVLESGVI